MIRLDWNRSRILLYRQSLNSNIFLRLTVRRKVTISLYCTLPSAAYLPLPSSLFYRPTSVLLFPLPPSPLPFPPPCLTGQDRGRDFRLLSPQDREVHSSVRQTLLALPVPHIRTFFRTCSALWHAVLVSCAVCCVVFCCA